MTLSTVFIKMFSRRGLALLCIVFLLAGFGLSYSWAVGRNLFSVSAQRTQNFTELYFTDPNAVPVKVPANQEQQVAFAITNRESATKTYTYAVAVDNGTGTKELSTHTITLKPGEQSVQQANYTVQTARVTALVSITLQQEKQIIKFRVWAS